MARRMNWRERGAAAVEFAIVLPLLALLLFGIVEFSLVMYDKSLITSASREGARFGAVFSATRPTCDQIYTAAVQPYEQGLVTFGGTKAINRNCSSREFQEASSTWTAWAAGVCVDPNDQLAVETVFNYTFLAIPDFVVGITGPLTLRSTTVMRCE